MNKNTVHAEVLIDELVRGGVRDLCLAPGSRSTPLVLAAANEAAKGRLRVRVFIDERSASFFALGLGKATGRPAVVLTTSGTAVANLLPAVVEAAWSETPLVVLTADRPLRLRDADANQVIVQPGIFSGYPVLALELPEAEASDRALRHLRAVVSRATAAARGLPAGPVHLNVPYDKPLEPETRPRASQSDSSGLSEDRGSSDVSAGSDVSRGSEASTGSDVSNLSAPGFAGRASQHPWTEIDVRRPRADDDRVDRIVARMREAERGVLVAGPHPEAGRLGPVLRALAAQWDVPLLADPLSGARHGGGGAGAVLAAYDLVLRDASIAQHMKPDLVIRVGAAPTSASLLAWLDLHADSPQVVVDAGRRWKDHRVSASVMVQACPVDFLSRVTGRLRALGGSRRPAGPMANDWTSGWIDADRAAMGAALEGEPHEGHIADIITRAVPDGTSLFVSSSMPIRDVDAYGGARSEALPIYGNRGASGIDGVVSSALGVAAGLDRPIVALIGDLAFLHDVNGLLAARESDARVVFVVVDNDGGGIFHMLPIREHEPAFTPYFATPHGADLAHGAALYGVPYHPTSLDGLPTALVEAIEAEATCVLAVASDRDANHAGHAASARRAVAAARAILRTG